jgi:cAMP phosphodiesterase
VQIRVLGAYGGSTPRHRQTSFLIDGTVALDAGAITAALPLEEQAKVRAILVTHSHMDHVNSLPFLVENVFGKVEGPIEVIAPTEVVSSLKKHLFNNDLWPDFTRIPNHLLPVVTFRDVKVGEPFKVNGLTAVAIPVALWAAAKKEPRLKAIFVECSFSDSMKEVADISKHLTPAMLRTEMEKFPKGVAVNIYHMKPPCAAAIVSEIQALGVDGLRLLDDGDELSY